MLGQPLHGLVLTARAELRDLRAARLQGLEAPRDDGRSQPASFIAFAHADGGGVVRVPKGDAITVPFLRGAAPRRDTGQLLGGGNVEHLQHLPRGDGISGVNRDKRGLGFPNVPF